MSHGIAQRRAAKAARRKKMLSERRKAAVAETRLSLADQMRRAAAAAPIHSCLANEGLFAQGIGNVILTRKTAGGRMAMAAFLVDVYCVGVKDVMVRQGDGADIEPFLATMGEVQPLASVDPAYARKLLRDLVAWARSIGLAPHPDYAAAELLFGAVSADACAESFRFGKNGRPLYMPGPTDTPAQIRQRTEALRRRLGDDGFDYALVDDFEDDDTADGDDVFEAEADEALESETGVRYDPNVAPDPAAWQALGETERQLLVETYHRRTGIEVPNAQLHAVLHAVVETQVALGDDLPVRRAIGRLMTEGLDRHEAIHAVAWVLARYLSEIMEPGAADPGSHAAYNAAIERLTAESWRAEFDSPEGQENR
jgi:hypothetical protein